MGRETGADSAEMEGSVGTWGEKQEQTVQRWRDIGRDTGADSAEMEGDVGRRDIGRDTGADSAEMQGNIGTSGEIQEQTVQR